MNDRNLDISKYSYAAYRTLKKTLGEYDAVVECNELAVLEFIESISGDEAQHRIQFLSQKHSIPVHSVDVETFSTRIRQFYIASVMQQFEQFLLGFKALRRSGKIIFQMPNGFPKGWRHGVSECYGKYQRKILSVHEKLHGLLSSCTELLCAYR